MVSSSSLLLTLCLGWLRTVASLDGHDVGVVAGRRSWLAKRTSHSMNQHRKTLPSTQSPEDDFKIEYSAFTLPSLSRIARYRRKKESVKSPIKCNNNKHYNKILDKCIFQSGVKEIKTEKSSNVFTTVIGWFG